MTSRDRVRTCMQLGKPDRVPVMCQWSVGYLFKNSGVDPVDIWLTSDGFAEALVRLQKKHRFDGLLINLPGRNPRLQNHIQRVARGRDYQTIYWKNGGKTLIPANDNPRYLGPAGNRAFLEFDSVDVESLFYLDPWTVSGISDPFRWDFDEPADPGPSFFPDHHLDALKTARSLTREMVSIHTEIFSPWSQFLEAFGIEQGLIAILTNPGKVKALLERLTEGAIILGQSQMACGSDAVLISSAFAGAGFISREQYTEFVLPAEKAVVTGIRSVHSNPVYTHTCGAIADRLDLMLATGTCGIDTLDPPPLGTVHLGEAKNALRNRAFIKGNLDPVNALLLGSDADFRKALQECIDVGKPGGGYILSTACSVAPETDPARLDLFSVYAEESGGYLD